MEETVEVDQKSAKPFSWRDPHAVFVIFLVGPEERPFGLQKDFLCAHSAHFRTYFCDKTEAEKNVERIERLPETTPEVFGLMQNFLYTGNLVNDDEELPGYDVLIATWKLGNEFDIPKLCDKTLEAMKECRRVSQSIPATPLLVQAWKDTPEASKLRKLLLGWAAEYLRSSGTESRAEFSKSLPQEVLSDLVVEMSELDSAPAIQVGHGSSPNGQLQHKNVHYLDTKGDGIEGPSKVPRRRSSDIASRHGSQNGQRKPLPGAPRTLLKTEKSQRPSVGNLEFSNKQKVAFCSDLINRMLSSPSYWTRLVPLFRDPVDPVSDDVPDYFEKIKKPMDLGTIKAKMDKGEYDNEEQFAADMRQIFTNCYTYWGEGTSTWETCKSLEKTFETAYKHMYKWIATNCYGDNVD